MVVIGFYITQLPLGIASKYFLISLGTLALCAVMYEFIIRRNNLTRVLFGLKITPVKTKQFAMKEAKVSNARPNSVLTNTF
jgi:hypothetical protein